MIRSWRNWIPAASLAAVFATSVGCHLCPCLRRNDDCISCPTSRFGTVNEDEKLKCKAHLNAKIDSLINRDGCTPEDERIPMLKRIADKANRESEIPVIKTAAKIKHEEEMCQQKIKAVKYLAEIGCGCYDKDGEVAKAMLAALNDCLPAVRLTAAQALAGCVCDEPIQRPCCTEEIAERLYDMAWGYNDDGSCVEPIFEIRQWAAYAYSLCPKRAEPTPPPTPVPPVETGNPMPESPAEPEALEQKKDEAANQPIPAQQKSASTIGVWRSAKSQPALTGVAAPASHEEEPLADSRVNSQSADNSHEAEMAPSEIAIIPGPLTDVSRLNLPEVGEAARPSAPARPASMSSSQSAAAPAQTAPLDGVVESVDVAGESAIVRLAKSATPVKNAKVLIRHRYILGRIQTIGEFEVTDVAPGMATIRPVAGTSIRKISTGDAATVLAQ